MITAMPRIAIAVQDFAAAVATFRDALGMPVVDFSDRTATDLGAYVGMCVPPGGSNIELMAPADPSKPLSQAIQRTIDRRGEGLYALMLEAPVPNDEAVELAARGLEVMPLMAGAGGRDVHPRATHGVLVRVYPNDSAQTGSGHRSEAPFLSGIARVLIATADASLAATAYGHGFGLPVDAAVEDADLGVARVRVHPPKGGVIDLVSPSDTTKAFAREIEATLKERHGGLHALVLDAADPAAVAEVLAARGVAVRTAAQGGGAIEATLFGTRFIIGG